MIDTGEVGVDLNSSDEVVKFIKYLNGKHPHVEKSPNLKYGYKHRNEYLVDGVKVSVQYERLLDNPYSCYDVKIRFDVDNFKRYYKFRKWLKLFAGDYFILIFNSDVIRIDIHMDLGLLFEVIEKHLHRPRALITTKYRKKRKSMYLGNMPKQLIAYEKKRKGKYQDYPKIKDKKLKSKELEMVRFEARFGKRCVPILKLSELKLLKEEAVFKFVKFSTVDIKLLNTASRKTQKNVYAFWGMSQFCGFQEAKRIMSKDRNFHRIEKFLKPHEIDLNKIYKKMARSFFKPRKIVEKKLKLMSYR